MRYESASETTLDDWADLRLALWGGERDELADEARQLLVSSTDACFLAHGASDRVLGFIEIAVHQTPDHTYGHIEAWYVRPEARRQGIGVGLIDRAEQWLIRRSVDAVFSDTDPDRYPASLAAHERSGYVPVRQVTLLKKLRWSR